MPKYDIIVFRMNTAGMLTCSTSFPPISRGKMVYFLRNVDDKITQANFRKVLIYLLFMATNCFKCARTFTLLKYYLVSSHQDCFNLVRYL